MITHDNITMTSKNMRILERKKDLFLETDVKINGKPDDFNFQTLCIT